MAKYIDVEPIIKGGWQLQRYNSGDGYVNQEHASLKDIPPADVRPVVRGRWVETSYDFWDCSLCGETLRMETDGICNFDKDPKFCPNCGSYNGGDADG